MRLYKVFRVIALLSYCFIMINGEMISFPFFLFLAISIFLGEDILAKASALIGIIGIILLLTQKQTKRTLLIEALALIMLILPIVERLTSVPINLFNYSTFIFPSISFIVFYILSVFFSYKEFKSNKISTKHLK